MRNLQRHEIGKGGYECRHEDTGDSAGHRDSRPEKVQQQNHQLWNGRYADEQNEMISI